MASLNVNVDVKGLEDLKKQIEFIEKLFSMKTDKKFQDYIQKKCLQTVQNITNQRLIGGTTDDDMIDEYKINHKIRPTDDGFILYNDTVLPSYMLSANPEDYPNGFSIALAFEYGVGIVGENSPKQGAWEYNMKNHNFAWYYTKYGELLSTYGYEGFEIYRYTAEEIKKNLSKWVKEYKKDGGVSQ